MHCLAKYTPITYDKLAALGIGFVVHLSHIRHFYRVHTALMVFIVRCTHVREATKSEWHMYTVLRQKCSSDLMNVSDRQKETLLNNLILITQQHQSSKNMYRRVKNQLACTVSIRLGRFESKDQLPQSCDLRSLLESRNRTKTNDAAL